ncbi:VCBS repeat-containing protein [bacterium]|nr:VCBS repeat-containing protein [bacterium]
MRWFSLFLLICLPFVTIAQPSWERRTIEEGCDAITVVAGNLDFDGGPDIVTSGPLRAYINDGVGQFWEDYTINDSWYHAVELADLDGDGDLDVVTCDAEHENQYWFENTGNMNQWISHLIFDNTTDYWRGCDTYDIDNDGDIDIVASAYWGIYWYENISGLGTQWTEHLIIDDEHAIYLPLIVDIDSDGDGDIVYQENYISLYWLENDMNGNSWTQLYVGSFPEGAGQPSAADINRDGNIDIVTCTTGGEVAWWNNSSGNGLNMTHLIIDTGAEKRQTSIADIDNDHDIDIIAVGDRHVTFYRNEDGVGGSWNEYTIWSSIYYWINIWGSCTLDVDNDLDYDVVIPVRALFGVHDGFLYLFECLNGGADELRVAFPNGGEVLRTGTTRNIVWNSTLGEDMDVCIELFLDGQFERVIVESTENDGIYEWTVPDDLPVDDQYLIQLQVVGQPYQDFSDAPFAITSTPNLVITPFEPSLIVPSAGGGYWYWVRIYNPTEYPVSGQLWADVELPNGNVIGPVMSTRIQLGPQGVYQPSLPFAQFVPGFAPPGVYQHIMHIGMHPDLIIDTDSFQFAKQPGNTVATTDPETWSLADWQGRSGFVPPEGLTESQSDTEAANEDELDLRLSPNPCNARTSVVVTLPAQATLEVVVFNTVGQEVARIAEGVYPAGAHTLTFDATNLASGMYFVQVQTGTETALRKMVVVK